MGGSSLRKFSLADEAIGIELSEHSGSLLLSLDVSGHMAIAPLNPRKRLPTPKKMRKVLPERWENFAAIAVGPNLYKMGGASKTMAITKQVIATLLSLQ